MQQTFRCKKCCHRNIIKRSSQLLANSALIMFKMSTFKKLWCMHEIW